ncbi:MAG: hypothetical protein HC836_16085 [Richelia sp. RM2_1_2]|nr:hypothetical protein [Richelia sp. RM2_1_2]
MSFNLNFKSLLSIIAVSSTFAFAANPTVAQTKFAQNSFPTTFDCIRQQDSLFVTVARRGNRQTSPLFIWRTNWGPKYPPEERCKIVSQRLTRAVAKNGGKLSGLSMTHAELNGYPILCYVTSKSERCNSENILLTLRKSESPKKVLEEITTFSVRGTGGGDSRGRIYAPLGEEVDNAFKENAVNESPSTQTTPNTVPINPIPESTPSSQPNEDI